MRNLGKYVGETRYFSAIIGADSHDINKICLENVQCINGEGFDCHLWVKKHKKIQAKDKGKAVTFRADVVEYERLADGSKDYGLDNLKDVKVIK